MSTSARTSLVLAVLGLAGAQACAPLMGFRNGEEEQLLRRTADEFCQAVTSGDAKQIRKLFEGSVRVKLQALAESGRPIPFTSGDAHAFCAAGRSWYLGGSRMFVEVRTTSGSDRLDIWRGDWIKDERRVSDVLYGRPMLVNGRRVRKLSEALDALGPAGAPSSAGP